MKKTVFLCIIVLFNIKLSLGQQSVKDSTIKTSGITFGYGYQIPQNDLAKRFGNNSNIEGTFFQKYKSNFEWSVNASFIFGNDVIEPGLLSNLITNEGIIINSAGNPAEITISQRGYTVSAGVSKIFSFLSPNPNSGFKLKLEAGYIWHEINIEDINNSVYAILDSKIKGYDRLTGGLLLKQHIGYQFMGNNQIINFYIGVEIGQGFTKSLRGYNYDTASFDNEARLDSYYGLRLSWIIPFYKRAAKEFYFD